MWLQVVPHGGHATSMRRWHTGADCRRSPVFHATAMNDEGVEQREEEIGIVTLMVLVARHTRMSGHEDEGGDTVSLSRR